VVGSSGIYTVLWHGKREYVCNLNRGAFFLKKETFFLKDLYKEECRRRGFTENELTALKELYAKSGGCPTVMERRSLMIQFGLSKEKVFGWFQNRRARDKKEINKKT
jgi:hypothetical protein